MCTFVIGDIHGCDREFSELLQKLQFDPAADRLYQNTVPYYIGEHFRCAHAGAKDEQLWHNDIHTLMMSHTLTRKNQYTGKLLLTGHIHLPHPTYFDGSGGAGQQLIYHQWQLLPLKGVICLDTGCAEGNRLTGMRIEEEQYYLENVKHRPIKWA